MPTLSATLYHIYTRLLRWESTRQVETVLAFLGLGWGAQMHFYGSIYKQTLPLEFVSLALLVAGAVQLVGILAGWIHFRKVALFLDSVIWTSLFVTILSLGDVAVTYAVLAFTSVWAYLVFSRTASLTGNGSK